MSPRSNAALQSHATRRIIRAYRAASFADLDVGLAWYDRASDVADALAAGTPYTRATTAGVIAALSPRCQWQQNVRAAATMVAAAAAGQPEPVVTGIRANRAKAWAILTADRAPELRGPKVRAFFMNIMGDTDAVTVDVWAARIAEGRENPRAPDGARYERLAAAYRDAAAIIGGVTPRDCQAVCWVAAR